MFFAEDRSIKSCVNKQKRGMKNLSNKKAAVRVGITASALSERLNALLSENSDGKSNIVSYTVSFFGRLADFASSALKSLFRRKTRVKIMAGTTTLAMISVICISANAAGYKLGYEVSVNGEEIGTVVDQSEAIAAVDLAKETISQCVGEDYDAEPVFSRTIVAPNGESSAEEMENSILSTVDGMTECAAVFADGEEIVSLSSRDDAEQLLQRCKGKYSPEEIADDMIVEFCENVEIKDSFIASDMIKSVDDAFALVTENKAVADYTVADESETLKSIAADNDMTLSEIKELNPDTSAVGVGDTVKIKTVSPLLSVRVIETAEYEEAVPFESKSSYSDELYVGETEVITEGAEGKASVTARIYTVNGKEEKRDIIERVMTVAPMPEIKLIGRKALPTSATGVFGQPTLSGKLTSNFGSRWGRSHNGVDISIPNGSSVYASDGGVVTYSGWMSGYGNYIVIDHQNGYQTAYGHNSQNLVSVGQRVAKGEKIALSGSTGNSTGPHLHFEVKKNGVYQNPLSYVSY